MQHLDEGTIHAWLDGALTPEEAARAEAHVKDCPQCQAAVAEARGFIAASSRILTALDNAPRGVIPAAAPARYVQPWVWRVAATVLVVATGTVLLVRERAPKRYDAATDRAEVPASQPTATGNAVAAGAAPTTADSQVSQQARTNTAVAPAAAPAALPQAFSLSRKAAPQRAPEQDLSAGAAGGGARLDERREVAPSRGRADAAPIPAPRGMMNTPVSGALGSVVVETPRQVAMKRTIGNTQTFYEVAPGDTVILEEQSSANLQSVVATGAAATRSAQPMLRAGKAAAVAEPQQKTESAAQAAAPPPTVTAMQDAQVGEIHRVSWLDPSSGRVLILSGRHSQEELQKIRAQIQKLRDAAAQTNKLPD